MIDINIYIDNLINQSIVSPVLTDLISIPSGNNIKVNKSVKDVFPTVPVKMNLPLSELESPGDIKQFIRDYIMSDHFISQNDNTLLHNLILNQHDHELQYIKLSDLNKNCYFGFEKTLEDANMRKVVIKNPGSHCGVNSKEVRIWYKGPLDLKNKKKSGEQLTIYLSYLSFTRHHSDVLTNLPETTGKEIYSTNRSADSTSHNI